jgi:hypothetical protein
MRRCVRLGQHMQFNRLKRREFTTLLAGAAAVWPLAARAQQGARMPRIGVLSPTIHEDAIRQGLRDLHYIDGKNVSIEYRATDGSDRLPDLAAELVALKADVIVATGS